MPLIVGKYLEEWITVVGSQIYLINFMTSVLLDDLVLTLHVIEFYRVGFNKTFKEWDKDNNGTLSFDEVKLILQDDYSDEQVEAMYEKCDKDGDGRVTCEEFLKLM